MSKKIIGIPEITIANSSFQSWVSVPLNRKASSIFLVCFFLSMFFLGILRVFDIDQFETFPKIETE